MCSGPDHLCYWTFWVLCSSVLFSVLRFRPAPLVPADQSDTAEPGGSSQWQWGWGPVMMRRCLGDVGRDKKPEAPSGEPSGLRFQQECSWRTIFNSGVVSRFLFYIRIIDEAPTFITGCNTQCLTAGGEHLIRNTSLLTYKSSSK